MSLTSRRFFHAMSVCAALMFYFATATAAAEPEFSGEVVIGATLPIAGDFDYYGLSAYYGAITAVKTVNARGGVNGKRLVLEMRDSRSDVEQGIRNIEELVRDHKVPAVIGPLLSDSAMAARETARRNRVVILSPMATLDALPEPDPWVFRSIFSNYSEAVALSRFQKEKFGASSVGVVYDTQHMATVELGETFAEVFAVNGGRVVESIALTAVDGAIDYETPLRRIAAAGPDFIFAAMYGSEATELIQTLKRLDIDIPVCGPNTWDNEIVFDGSGTRLIGTSFASVLFERAATRQFREFFTAMEEAGMENPDASAACAYDAVMLLAKAMENGESAEEIRQGLLAVRNFNLATGRISITQDGDTRKPVLVRMVERQGQWLVPVYAERYDPPAARRR